MCDGRERVGVVTRLCNYTRVTLFYLVSAVWIPIIIAVAMVRPGRPDYYKLVRAWARFTLRWFGIRVAVTGAANLAPGRDYVVLANHRSHFDPLALIVALDCETRWVAKRELQRVPIFGYGLRVTGQILIDRSNRQAAIGELRRHLGQRGASVVFFPEGRRSFGSQLLPFKKGGAVFAIDAGLDIVPVAIAGSEKVLPRDTILVRPGLIRIAIGEPFYPGASETADRDMALSRAREAIEAMLGLLESEQPAPARATGLPLSRPPRTSHV